MIEKQTWSAPNSSSYSLLLNLQAANASSVVTTVSTFAAQPDIARNLIIVPAGSSTNFKACLIAINGLDYLGHAIEEDFTFGAAQSAQVVGLKAFASVTSVVFPSTCVQSPFGASVSLGVGNKLGLKRCMDQKGYIFHAVTDGTKDATAPTMTVDASVVSLNGAVFTSAPNASRVFDLFFMQNFRCVR